MKKLLTIAAFTFLFSGHLFSSETAEEEKILYKTIDDNIPNIEKKITLYLGDQMLVQRNGQYKECFIPKTSIKVGWRGSNYELIPNKPVCKKKKDSLYYYPNYTLLINCRGANITVGTCPYLLSFDEPINLIENENSYEINIGIPRDNTEKKVKFHKNLKINDLDKNSIDHQIWFLYTDNSFQQTIEYAGKSGTTLKFIYTEFINDFARDAFTREFTIDLEEGNIGAYKGAVFEVIDATNSSITYKVKRHFQ